MSDDQLAGADVLPETGSIGVMPVVQAAETVEEVVAEGAVTASDALLIALDIDGTVLLEDESLSPGVVDAVKHARAAGHEIMLATGRSWEGTHRILQMLNLSPEYVVCSNGAVILKRIDGSTDRYERVHTESFDPAAVLGQLREHLPDARYMVELPDGHRRYTDPIDDWTLTGAERVPFEQLSGELVSRVVVVSPGHDEDDFSKLIDDMGLHQVSYAIGWTAWLDIAPHGVDKSTALERVREWLGMEPARVLVMGDGRNDLGMFDWALRNGGRAIAMAQGPDEVRSAAGEITTSVQDGGVAAILHTL